MFKNEDVTKMDFKGQIVTKIDAKDGFYLTDTPYDMLVDDLDRGNRKWIELNTAKVNDLNKPNKLLLNFDYIESVKPVTLEEVNDIEQKNKHKDSFLEKLGDLISEDD